MPEKYKEKFDPDSWIYGDITVDENGAPYTYRYSMLFSFRNLEEFQAARRIIEALFEGVSGK